MDNNNNNNRIDNRKRKYQPKITTLMQPLNKRMKHNHPETNDINHNQLIKPDNNQSDKDEDDDDLKLNINPPIKTPIDNINHHNKPIKPPMIKNGNMINDIHSINDNHIKINQIKFKDINGKIYHNDINIKNISFQCEQCDQYEQISDKQYNNGLLTKYIKRFICIDCFKQNKITYKQIKGDKRKEMLLLNSINILCIEKCCKDAGKICNGPNAIKNWTSHHLQNHPTLEFWNIINKKLCAADLCTITINNNQNLCILHSNEQQMYNINDNKNKNKQHNNNNSTIILDGDKAEFNINNATNYCEIRKGIYGDTQRDHAAKILTNSLNKIADANSNIQRAIDGVLQLRYFSPTFHYVPYRDDDIIHNELENSLRSKLYENKKWKKLVERIQYEQDKRNRKRIRQRQKNQKNEDLEHEQGDIKMSEIHQQSNIINQHLDQQLKQIKLSEILKNSVNNIDIDGEISQ